MSPSLSTAPLRDAILIELIPAADPLAVVTALTDTVVAAGGTRGALTIYRTTDGEKISAYLPSDAVPVEYDQLRETVATALKGFADGAVEVCRLRAQLAIAGASAGVEAPYRYVVRTDVIEGGGAELESWYDVEHMPSLAAVPGAVLAQRMLCVDTVPLYYACYDLTGPDVLRSEPWLDVRATEWSGRVRPTFRDTRRVLSQRIDPVAP